MERDEREDGERYLRGPLLKHYAAGPDPMESNPVMEEHCCIGCVRTPCLASEPGFTFYCCRRCAETGLHSAACDSEWEYKRVRRIGGVN